MKSIVSADDLDFYDAVNHRIKKSSKDGILTYISYLRG